MVAMNLRHPSAEVKVDAELAEALLESQYPQLLVGPLVLVDEGWDNMTYRVGSELALRLPRRKAAVALLLNEQKWLPLVAGWVSLDVPRPVAVGSPCEAFGWPWSVVEWVPGQTLDDETLSPVDARVLAKNLRLLHRPAPPDAPLNRFRGVPLVSRSGVVEDRLARLGLDALTVPWRRAVEAPCEGTRVWLHGDLHPRNVITQEGALSGLIDWGDITAGDVGTDLACAWTLLDAPARQAFRAAYDPSDAEWTRAFGWAVNLGAALVDSGEPQHARIGRTVIRRLVEGSS